MLIFSERWYSMEFIWTKEQQQLDSWDKFLSETPRGHYTQLSDWLKSYTSYGFEYELLLGMVNGEIVLGCGIIKAKFLKFKFYILSCGPIVKEGYESYTDEAIKVFLEKAKAGKAVYCHVNLPVMKEDNSTHTLPSVNADSIYMSGTPGIEFKYVASINGFRWVDLNYTGENKYEEAAKKFNTLTKRNVKKAQSSGLVLKYATTEEEIKKAWDLIVQNGETQGYSVRSWKEFGKVLVNLITKGHSILPYAEFETEIKGALFLIDTGKRLSYISGGTLREENDLKVGHFLHNEMLKLGISKGYDGYDISVGGSDGVTRFKQGFGANYQEFIGARHWVLNKPLFKVYKAAAPFIKKHKGKIARILNSFK
jgi:lipid II:glycine glycyltransferase (peptidoglycan interpeptide bridge formation enzyme)